MSKINQKSIILFFVAIAISNFVFSSVSASAEVIEEIYSETFDGFGLTGLDGVAPTIGPEGVFWAAKDEFVKTDGSVTSDPGGMLLPFTPELDKVYTLSMHMTHVGTKYLGLGFTKDPINYAQADTGNRFPQKNGLAFMLYGDGGVIKTYGGLNAANEIVNTGVYSESKVWLSIVIDTTGDGSSFTADFQIDGESITGGPKRIAQSVDNINYAGIGSYGKPSGGSPAGSMVDNFRLVEGLDELPFEPAVLVVSIYYEAFDGNGLTGFDGVDPTLGDGTWASKGQFVKTDGSINGLAGGAFLPFAPQIDKVYNLSIDMNHIGAKYLGIGFTKDPINYGQQDTGNRFPQKDGLAFILYGNGGVINIYGGLNATNEIANTGTYVPGTDINLSIIIDTAGKGNIFTADFQIDGKSITDGPQTVNQPVSSINYVGIGSYGTRDGGSPAGSTVDNFYLTEGIHDPNAPAIIDAGIDMITWSGEPVVLDATVINNSDPVAPLTYDWSANPAEGVVFDPNAYVEDPTVTITRATDNPSAVTLTLAVNTVDGLEVNVVTDTLTIDLYDDACRAARLGRWLDVDYPADLHGDCIINLKDFALIAEQWLDGFQFDDLAEMASIWLDDYKLTEPATGNVPLADLFTAITDLTEHVEGTSALTLSKIGVHKRTIDSQSQFIGDNNRIIEACLDLVQAYDTEIGPLFVNGSPIQTFTRSEVTDNIHWTVFNVMQYIMDYVYTAENISKYGTLLDGYKFGSSAHFPGSVDPPSDPDATYTVPINGSFLLIPYVREIDKGTARKPTGAYVAPGSIATVIVPSSLVGKGYQIRVGAYTWDHSKKPTVKRLDRVSLTFDIGSTEVKVANPLGGGIYIEVPYLADAGIVDIQIKNAVRAPYFSAKSFHATTLEEWQNVECHHPAPTADFQSDKFMMQVPTSWIYALDDPVTLMEDWDASCDATNDLMGFPHVRGKETYYTQVDIQMRGNAYYPGYPTSNAGYDPDRDYGGNYGNYHLSGPRNAYSFVFHEQGHGYLFTKFNGETESTVNLLHVPVWQEFGYSLDDAFRASRSEDYKYRTLETTAVCWMMCENFMLEQSMDEKDKKYQLKGHAKYVDIARLFGWDALGDYWHSINEDYENGIIWPKNCTDYDRIILRLSEKAGVDLRPLLQFWGIQPDNAADLASEIVAAGLPASADIYDTLVRYKSLIPDDNAAYQDFAYAWWNYKQPRSVDDASNVYQTEAYHAVLWDTYDAAYEAQIQTNVQNIIDLYFPDGRPGTGL